MSSDAINARAEQLRQITLIWMHEMELPKSTTVEIWLYPSEPDTPSPLASVTFDLEDEEGAYVVIAYRADEQVTVSKVSGGTVIADATCKKPFDPEELDDLISIRWA